MRFNINSLYIGFYIILHLVLKLKKNDLIVKNTLYQEIHKKLNLIKLKVWRHLEWFDWKCRNPSDHGGGSGQASHHKEVWPWPQRHGLLRIASLAHVRLADILYSVFATLVNTDFLTGVIFETLWYITIS